VPFFADQSTGGAIMRRIANVVSAFVVLCKTAFSAQPSSAESPVKVKTGTFDDLRKRVEASDSTIDFTQLRLAYAKSDDYRPYRKDLNEIQSEMFESFRSRQYEKTIELAEKVLQKEYINIGAHRHCEMAYDSLGDSAKGVFHRWVANGLIASILKDRDGRSKETAYSVVLISEEYVVLNVLRLQLTSQALVSGEAGKHFDVLEVLDRKSGSPSKIYFDIALPFSKLKNKPR
jgi:hypothetical protein